MSDQVPPPPGPPTAPPIEPPASPPPGWQPPTGAPVEGPHGIPTMEPARSNLRLAVVVGLAVVAALTVVVAAILVPRVVDSFNDGDVASPSIDDPTTSDILVVNDLSTEHRDDVDVEYDQVPPLGGPHDPEWLACGVFDEPLRDENAVHDLEHGTVWITYRPDISDEDLATLKDAVPDDGMLSPYPDLPAPVVVTVWGVQQRLDGAEDPRLAEFIDEYGDGHTSPEPFVTCEGGLTDPQGGRNANA